MVCEIVGYHTLDEVYTAASQLGCGFKGEPGEARVHIIFGLFRIVFGWFFTFLMTGSNTLYSPRLVRPDVRLDVRPNARPDVRPNGLARPTLGLARPNYSCQQLLLLGLPILGAFWIGHGEPQESPGQPLDALLGSIPTWF